MSHSSTITDVEELSRQLETVNISNMPKEKAVRRSRTGHSSSQRIVSRDDQKHLLKLARLLGEDVQNVPIDATIEQHRLITFFRKLYFWVRMDFPRITGLSQSGFYCAIINHEIVAVCFECKQQIDPKNPSVEYELLHTDTCRFYEGESDNIEMSPRKRVNAQKIVDEFIKYVNDETATELSNRTSSSAHSSNPPIAPPRTKKKITKIIEKYAPAHPLTNIAVPVEEEDSDGELDLYSGAGEVSPPKYAEIEDKESNMSFLSIPEVPAPRPQSPVGSQFSSTSHFPRLSEAQINIQLETPMYIAMNNAVARCQSFMKPQWNYSKRVNNIQAPIKDFAMAGFFYEGVIDKITCFYCGGSLSGIESQVIPHILHIKHFPRCEFMLKKYGAEEVTRIAALYPNEQRAYVLPREQLKEVAKEPEHLPPAPSLRDQEREEARNKMFQEAMQTPQVRKVIQEYRYPEEQVKNLIRRKIWKDDCYYESTEALLQKLQRDVDDLSDDGSEHDYGNLALAPITRIDRFPRIRYPPSVAYTTPIARPGVQATKTPFSLPGTAHRRARETTRSMQRRNRSAEGRNDYRSNQGGSSYFPPLHRTQHDLSNSYNKSTITASS